MREIQAVVDRYIATRNETDPIRLALRPSPNRGARAAKVANGSVVR